MRKYGLRWHVFLFLCDDHVACAKPYMRKPNATSLVTTNINLPYWQEAAAGFQDAPWPSR